MIDITKIKKRSKITLSDGSVFVFDAIFDAGLGFANGTLQKIWTMYFDNGLSQCGVFVDGSNVRPEAASIVEVEPPKEEVDLSTLMVGDICVTRSGDIVPWNMWDRSGSKSYPFRALIGGIDLTYNSNGSCWWSKDPNDIVHIERASDEERAIASKKPIFSFMD